ncbi:hemolysin III family protein [Nocardioides sp. CFH 31398]|uniref:PAQR family membrane homeostasis protein TrhA n=1 Tax=Nocardioides sp. CFH 31398 TaxID=2919579 RepID=UPI001F053F3F|nr:hemolysin III family protein [Nocardioides sp. CFH 31398]MCH1868140.1 hemolysin III family protein [Nocardioides sp. CFH 31398]
MNARVADLTQGAADHVREAFAEVKPKLRGWLHLATAPLTLAAGIVLFVLSPNAVTKIGSAVFTGSALVLFTVSAIYHRGTWSPKVWAFLRRFDHSNIFLLIAGSYTPFSLLLLEGTPRVVLLTTVWTGAVLGVLFRVFWAGAPRWLYVPIYIALGWAAVFFIPDFAEGASGIGVGVGTAVLVLVIVGGGLYTLGGLVYGLKRPNPWPKYFGFHEVFHTLTILAFASHYVGVSLLTYSLR